MVSLKKGEIEEGEDVSKVNFYGEVSLLRCGFYVLLFINCFGSLFFYEMLFMILKEMELVFS